MDKGFWKVMIGDMCHVDDTKEDGDLFNHFYVDDHQVGSFHRGWTDATARLVSLERVIVFNKPL